MLFFSQYCQPSILSSPWEVNTVRSKRIWAYLSLILLILPADIPNGLATINGVLLLAKALPLITERAAYTHRDFVFDVAHLPAGYRGRECFVHIAHISESHKVVL